MSSEVEKLAETLHSSGLAASYMEAMQKAQDIVGRSSEKVATLSEEHRKSQEEGKRVSQAPDQSEIQSKPITNMSEDIASSGKTVSELLQEEGNQDHSVVMDEDPSDDAMDEPDDNDVGEGPQKEEPDDEHPEENKQEDPVGGPESKQDLVDNQPEKSGFIETSESPAKERPTLTEEEKEKTDLTKLFKF